MKYTRESCYYYVRVKWSDASFELYHIVFHHFSRFSAIFSYYCLMIGHGKRAEPDHTASHQIDKLSISRPHSITRVDCWVIKFHHTYVTYVWSVIILEVGKWLEAKISNYIIFLTISFAWKYWEISCQISYSGLYVSVAHTFRELILYYI